MTRTTLRIALPLAAVGLVAVPATLLGDTSVACRGTEAICTANVPLAGGASNEKVQVQLPGTALKLRTTTAAPPSVRGAFSADAGTYSLGGSLYTFNLNAVESITAGWASMTFTNPARPQAGPAASVRCLGTEKVCTAHISLKGGASNKVIKVALPGTNLTLANGARAYMPKSAKGAYSLSGGTYTTGGSIYQFKLNAVGSLGTGAWLALTFGTTA